MASLRISWLGHVSSSVEFLTPDCLSIAAFLLALFRCESSILFGSAISTSSSCSRLIEDPPVTVSFEKNSSPIKSSSLCTSFMESSCENIESRRNRGGISTTLVVRTLLCLRDVFRPCQPWLHSGVVRCFPHLGTSHGTSKASSLFVSCHSQFLFSLGMVDDVVETSFYSDDETWAARRRE
ncbi:hypothetical protein BKA61DRAFT_611575 [Leptodontidium sp. MPI-SDFR-AT-0119]|nr:hypothetical protein BKA61DRAFT_611575 [Leptodontidium sp. MPI-SDFR-AT-0119]